MMLLKKSFWYGAAVWTFHEAGQGYLSLPSASPFCLSALEWTQRYLPGRMPEISDPCSPFSLPPLCPYSKTAPRL